MILRGGAHKYEKVLIVEGIDDKHSIIGLMKGHVPWPEQEPWPVFIKEAGGASDILSTPLLSAQLKAQGIRTVGIMLDADTNPEGRYQSIKNTCAKFSFVLPTDLPPEGVVAQNAGGMRVGLWIMPDNASKGYLETFLRYLVPNKEEPIWKHAVGSVETAKSLNAQCPDKDLPKANLYTWLAWQSTPGQQPGMALTKRILDPNSPYAAPFVKWFRNLFEL